MSIRTHVLIAVILVVLVGCEFIDRYKLQSHASQQIMKSSAQTRARLRAYDGAPPVVPHKLFNIKCIDCHNTFGKAVEGVGFAPPSPHEPADNGLGATARCQQCHVFAQTKELFVASDFQGLQQDLRKGERLHYLAPPVIPHRVFMRENCLACHAGLAAREEIRCSHPQRIRCIQCHAQVATTTTFADGRSMP